MTRTETSQLLSLIRSYDNRKADDATVLAWHAVLHDLDLADCQAAVIEHMGTSEAYLMPVHIRRGVREIERQRIRAERDRLAIEQAHVTDPRPLKDRSEEIQQFVSSIRAALPEGDPDTLWHGRGHWRQVREARERAENAEPNPHYDPAVAARAAAEIQEEGR